MLCAMPPEIFWQRVRKHPDHTKNNARPPSFVVSALKKTSNGWNQRLDLCLEEREVGFLAVLLADDFFVVDLDDVDFADDLGGS